MSKYFSVNEIKINTRKIIRIISRWQIIRKHYSGIRKKMRKKEGEEPQEKRETKKNERIIKCENYEIKISFNS